MGLLGHMVVLFLVFQGISILFSIVTVLGNPGGSDGKASACNAGDLGWIPGSERSLGEGNGNPVHILAWEIPWREESGGLQSLGSQRVGHNLVTKQQQICNYVVK